MRCPNCGNYVEGKKIKSYSNKVARQGAKSLVHGATSVGGTTTGAAIGTAILPGIGTVLGAAAGFIGSAMFNQRSNESIDKAGDYIEDEFANIEYEYVCPKCGKKWTSNDQVRSYSKPSQARTKTKSKPKPRTSNSKGSLPPTSRQSSSRTNAVLQLQVLSIATQVYGTPSLTLDTSLGRIDKWKKSNLIYMLENQFGITIPPQKISRFNTLRDLANYVEKVVANTGGSINTNLTIEDFVLNTAANIMNQSSVSLDGDFVHNSDYVKKRIIDQIVQQTGLRISENTINSFYSFRDIANYLKNPNQVLPERESNSSKTVFESSSSKTVSENLNDTHSFSTSVGASNTELSHSSNNETEYVEALKDFLEDGEISDRERRMLDRVRKSLGISEQRAAELETSLKTPQLTEDEQEYLDMYREYADEGEITEKARRRLDRFASALGISPERMKELESIE